MELMKWTPKENVFGLRTHVNDLLEDFFAPIRFGNLELADWDWKPAADIYEDEANIYVKAELPGVDKKDIQVDVKDRRLTLKGVRSADKELKEETVYRRERFTGRFERTFMLPADVDAERIKAEYRDGVLNITIPKPEERKPRKVTVH